MTDETTNLLANPYLAEPISPWFWNQAASGSAHPGGGLRMSRDSDRSTPGLLQRVELEPGAAYVLEMNVIADGGCTAWAGNGDKRQLATAPAESGEGVQTLKVKFRTPDDGRAVVGVLFSSGSPQGHSVVVLSARLRRNILAIPDLPPSGRYGSPVIAGMASIPGREKSLSLAIDSLQGQVDHIFVYLNNHVSVPQCLNKANITVFRSQDHGDLRDNGKFFILDHLKSDVFFFSVDDDIVYPSDYVWRLVNSLKSFELKAAVGVHGAIYPRVPASFFSRSVVHFQRPLDQTLAVSVLGTGTTAFHTSVVKPRLADFGDGGIADLRLAAFLKANGVPALAVARSDKWLVDANDQAESASSDTLYAEAKQTKGPAEFLAGAAPWGFGAIEQALGDARVRLHPAATMVLKYGRAVEEGRAEEIIIDGEQAEILTIAQQLGWTPLQRQVVADRLRAYFDGAPA
ncbi:hypothetical protein [Brevundimonas lutea]|uniref:hypothetical protein n=1 Tax=Brevundimonas lutea TaxID=2293980 RepID=UPI000F03BB81|nr:hypothetical protein [Brevundimonas lutea]